MESLSFLKSSKGKRKYSRVAPAQTARLTRAKRFGQLNCKGGGGVSRGTVVLFQKGRQSSRTLAEELPQLREGKKKKKTKRKQTSPTDFMILIGSEGDSSIMDQWSLSVLQGKEKNWPFASLLVLSQPSLLQCLKAE